MWVASTARQLDHEMCVLATGLEVPRSGQRRSTVLNDLILAVEAQGFSIVSYLVPIFVRGELTEEQGK